MSLLRFLFIFLSVFLSTGCSSWRITETLKDIESYIMERPDSALAVLDSMDRSLLTTDRHKAHHALLHAMALDKNFIDVDDDSLANIAVRYFSRKGPEKYHARSLYYQGLAYYYQGEYNKAIVEFTKAEAAAQRSDSLYLGMTKSFQADVYGKTYNDVEELKCLEEAYDIYTSLSCESKAQIMKYRIAQTYTARSQYQEGETLFKELLNSSDIDPVLKSEVLRNYAFLKIIQSDMNADISIKLYEEVMESEYCAMTYQDYWAYAYSLNMTGDVSGSKNIVNELSAIDTSSSASYWQYLIYKSRGNFPEALKFIEHSNKQDKGTIVSLLSQSLAIAQRNYYESQSEITGFKVKTKNQTIIILIILSLFSITIILWLYTRRIRIHNQEKEQYLKYADEIKRQLEEYKNEDYPALKRKYMDLYKAQFETIGALYEQYSISSGRANAEHSVYSKVVSLINDFRNDYEDWQKFESILNADLDNIIANLRNEIPKLKQMDVSMFCFMILGFDVTTISHLLNVSMNTIYIRKSRLRQRIEELSPAHYHQFLEILS